MKQSSKGKDGNMEHMEQSDGESLHNEKSMLHKESSIRRKKIFCILEDLFDL